MTAENEREQDRSAAIRSQIDENLKRVYAAKVNEELPDRFRQLLAQLQLPPAASDRNEK